MVCEFFTAFVTNIFFSFFLMKNVQSYFLLNKKLIGIKKDIFYALPIATSPSMETALIVHIQLNLELRLFSKRISPNSSLGEISFLSPLYQKTILRMFLQYRRYG
jgi:hypothetical protein